MLSVLYIYIPEYWILVGLMSFLPACLFQTVFWLCEIIACLGRVHRDFIGCLSLSDCVLRFCGWAYRHAVEPVDNSTNTRFVKRRAVKFLAPFDFGDLSLTTSGPTKQLLAGF